jgi:hypothetical protein
MLLLSKERKGLVLNAAKQHIYRMQLYQLPQISHSCLNLRINILLWTHHEHDLRYHITNNDDMDLHNMNSADRKWWNTKRYLHEQETLFYDLVSTLSVFEREALFMNPIDYDRVIKESKDADEMERLDCDIVDLDNYMEYIGRYWLRCGDFMVWQQQQQQQQQPSDSDPAIRQEKKEEATRILDDIHRYVYRLLALRKDLISEDVKLFHHLIRNVYADDEDGTSIPYNVDRQLHFKVLYSSCQIIMCHLLLQFQALQSLLQLHPFDTPILLEPDIDEHEFQTLRAMVAHAANCRESQLFTKLHVPLNVDRDIYHHAVMGHYLCEGLDRRHLHAGLSDLCQHLAMRCWETCTGTRDNEAVTSLMMKVCCNSYQAMNQAIHETLPSNQMIHQIVSATYATLAERMKYAEFRGSPNEKYSVFAHITTYLTQVYDGWKQQQSLQTSETSHDHRLASQLLRMEILYFALGIQSNLLFRDEDLSRWQVTGTSTCQPLSYLPGLMSLQKQYGFEGNMSVDSVWQIVHALIPSSVSLLDLVKILMQHNSLPAEELSSSTVITPTENVSSYLCNKQLVETFFAMIERCCESCLMFYESMEYLMNSCYREHSDLHSTRNYVLSFFSREVFPMIEQGISRQIKLATLAYVGITKSFPTDSKAKVLYWLDNVCENQSEAQEMLKTSAEDQSNMINRLRRTAIEIQDNFKIKLEISTSQCRM